MAFLDDELKENILLTSSNSINVARWLPQQIYYVLAMTQLAFDQEPIVATNTTIFWASFPAKKPMQRLRNLAPTSLNARVGP